MNMCVGSVTARGCVGALEGAFNLLYLMEVMSCSRASLLTDTRKIPSLCSPAR